MTPHNARNEFENHMFLQMIPDVVTAARWLDFATFAVWFRAHPEHWREWPETRVACDVLAE